MQTEAIVSVVIPTYNRANELLRAVNSALKQTHPIAEILICDDGSTDNSKYLIKELNNPSIKWIDCGKNGGPAIPRNIGIKTSIGNWIAFLDSDDVWHPNKINTQLQHIAKLKVKASCTNANRILDNRNAGLYSDFTNSTISLTDLFYVNSVICSSAFIEKKLLMETSFFPTDYRFNSIEDFALWLRIATKTQFAFVNEPLVDYYDNFNTSIRSEYKNEAWDDFEVIFFDFASWVRTNNIVLSDVEKTELKLLFKRIKRKGQPGKWEEFKRRLNDKLKNTF